MSRRLFGTDGVRGRFGTPPLDENTVRRLGAALGGRLVQAASGTPSRVVLGGDTRASTPQICRWLAAELAAHGVDTVFLGVVPTPAIARTVATSDAACGLAVSASHNPYPDNGIKLIDGDGFKWPEEAEAGLERAMLEADLKLAGGEAELEVNFSVVRAYISSLAESLGGHSLAGLRVVLDAGNGAASPYAQKLFEDLDASVTMLGDAPNGENINLDCGSTHPENLAATLREEPTAYDVGFSFDGDADRVIVADHTGLVRDGDAVLYLWARYLKTRKELPGNAIVATSMSNLGLQVALARSAIDVVRCGVGDREVVATLRDQHFALGGEQSGHIVNLALSTTGDGLLTALQIASILHQSACPLVDLLKDFEQFPQLLRNLRVAAKPPLDSLPSVVETSREVEAELGDRGRLVLRYSGTEPLVRIMLEGPDEATIGELADRLEAVLDAELNPSAVVSAGQGL